MINKIGNAGCFQGRLKRQEKRAGRTHARNDELKSYRKTIQEANENMVKAVKSGDYEAADRWSRIIDNIQGKILEIISQEDGHKYKQINHYKEVGTTAVDAAGKAVKVAEAGAKLVALA